MVQPEMRPMPANIHLNTIKHFRRQTHLYRFPHIPTDDNDETIPQNPQKPQKPNIITETYNIDFFYLYPLLY